MAIRAQYLGVDFSWLSRPFEYLRANCEQLSVIEHREGTTTSASCMAHPTKRKKRPARNYVETNLQSLWKVSDAVSTRQVRPLRSILFFCFLKEQPGGCPPGDTGRRQMCRTISKTFKRACKASCRADRDDERNARAFDRDPDKDQEQLVHRAGGAACPGDTRPYLRTPCRNMGMNM